MLKKKKLFLGAISLSAVLLGGCASNTITTTKPTYGGTVSVNALANPYLLLPAPPANKTIFIRYKNVTDQQNINLVPALTQALQSKGYTVTTDITTANQVLEVDLLQAGKNSMTNVNMALAGGVGYPIATLKVSNTDLLIPTNNSRAAITNASVQNLTYSLIVDETISLQNNSKSFQQQSQVSSQAKLVTNVQQTLWDNYQSRVVVYATQANVTFDQATAALTAKLVPQLVQPLN